MQRKWTKKKLTNLTSWLRMPIDLATSNSNFYSTNLATSSLNSIMDRKRQQILQQSKAALQRNSIELFHERVIALNQPVELPQGHQTSPPATSFCGVIWRTKFSASLHTTCMICVTEFTWGGQFGTRSTYRETAVGEMRRRFQLCLVRGGGHVEGHGIKSRNKIHEKKHESVPIFFSRKKNQLHFCTTTSRQLCSMMRDPGMSPKVSLQSTRLRL